MAFKKVAVPQTEGAFLTPYYYARKQPWTVSSDHPLSLGFNLFVATDHPLARRVIRWPKKELQALLGSGKNAEGLHAVWDTHRVRLVAINAGPCSKVRLVELIVHEVSHVVDDMFRHAVVSPRVDTEIRAYYNDWIVGKILQNFKL